MQFRRRKQRFCEGCGELLDKRPTESVETFLSRRTCNSSCTKEARSKRGSNRLCFCGGYKQEGSPFCSWDCRLISIKCKEWGIPASIKGYNKRKQELVQEQFTVDSSKKNVDLAVWLEMRQSRN